MEQKRERIMKICGWAYVALAVGIIIYIIIALLDMAYELGPLLDLPFATPAVNFGLMGQRGPIDSLWFVIPAMLLYHGIMMFAMIYVRGVFKDLRNGGSPFSKKVSTAASGIAGAFIGLGLMHSNMLMFFAAALMGLFYLIFEYGRILQEDADHTL